MTQPRFSDIQHPDLAPEWMKEGLDQIFGRLGDEVENSGFSFWVDQYYDDNNSYSTKADFWVRLKGMTGEDAQCRLDEIPGMRRLERRSGELWHLLPISYDDEASLIGEVEFVIKRDALEFSVYDDGNDLTSIRMVAEFVDGAWRCYDEITFYTDISETLRLTATPERVLEAIDLTSIGFKNSVTEAKLIGGEINEDDAIVLRFEPGLFRHFEADGERE